MQSSFDEPLNLGQDRMVSINELAHMIAAIANFEVQLKHVRGPQGVRGRNSDNSLLRTVLAWEPRISLEDGLAKTYSWIEDQVAAQLGVTNRRSTVEVA
jgi:nucleoside-diphosphate-sugar epimerase